MKIYGPVPSWRLGNSLGVDIVEAPKGYSKLCSFNCIYCQLGHKEYRVVEPQKIGFKEEDLDILKKKIKETKPDFITFSGEGEPTINLNLGHIAKKIKKITKIPVAVLTNASFVDLKEVRFGLDECDLVIAKIDAANQRLFEEINCPNKGIKIKDIIEGIKLLKTNVAIQTLLLSVKNLTNSDDNTINELINAYKEINNSKAIQVYLGTAYRPSDFEGLESVDEDRIREIALYVQEKTGIEVVYYRKAKVKTVKRKLEQDELRKEVLALLKRRPCTKEEISTRFGGTDISKLLYSFINRGLLKEYIQKDKKFYTLKGGDL